MYVRMTFFRVKEGKMDDLRNLYNKEVISAHKDHKGIRFVHLLECMDSVNDGISITAWDTKADVDSYEKSGDYEKLVAMFKEMYSNEPVLKSYEITAAPSQSFLEFFRSLNEYEAPKFTDTVPGNIRNGETIS